MNKRLLFGVIAATVGMSGVATVVFQVAGRTPLITGRYLSTEAPFAEVGSQPINLLCSPDGRYVISTTVGFRQQLSVLDAKTGALSSKHEVNEPGSRGVRPGLYYGLAFSKSKLFASRGAMDEVAEFRLEADGSLSLIRTFSNPGPKNQDGLPHHIAGIALSSNESLLYTVNNQSHRDNDFTGSVSAIDLSTGKEVWKTTVPAFPLGIVAGSNAVYTVSERDGIVSELDPQSGKLQRSIKVGAQPTSLALSKDGGLLAVTNSGSDTLSLIETTSGKVTDTILLRPASLANIPGSTPLGVTFSPDEKRLYIAMADLNAVAVVDLASRRLSGFLEAGWYPTAVTVTPDGSNLFVSNLRGNKIRNPNSTDVRGWGQYTPTITEGTVSRIALSQALGDLKASTNRVLDNSDATSSRLTSTKKEFVKPPIEHVIYVIKENRTYDQVLGDLPRGNNDPKLTLFPREVTPNQHALAERFVQLDNFYVCGDVSYDGWIWSTQGMLNAYANRNTSYNYSGRGRNYDSEGMNNKVAVDLRGIPDISRSEGGYLWEPMLAKKLKIRNYGIFPNREQGEEDPSPNRRELVDVTSLDFKLYDVDYADSDAWVKHSLKPGPRQNTKFGKFNAPSRMSAWLREFEEFEKTKTLPHFSMIMLGNNHTAGSSPGRPTPRAYVADNDYAVGQLVEAVSKSSYWMKTAIFILEDDPQNGFDHVDAHRSPAFVITPYIEKNTLDSRFYNTVSLIRTMGLLLGMEPHNQYVATTRPFLFFKKNPVNADPYQAILPSRSIIEETNKATAYRSADSERLVNPKKEEPHADIELNDILWGMYKGPKSKRPAFRGVQWNSQQLKK